MAKDKKTVEKMGKGMLTNRASSSPFFSDNVSGDEKGKEKKSNGVESVAKMAIRPFLIKASITAAIIILFVIIIAVLIASFAVYDDEHLSPLKEKLKEVRLEYVEDYNVSIDTNMIIAALAAEQDVEIYSDVDAVEDEIRLLAKYQITTHINGNCNSSTKRQIATNDDNGVFSSSVTDEKNYQCDSSVGDTYYSVSVEKGSFNDDNSGSIFFWNLVDEDFIFEYYQEYMPGDRNSNEAKEKIKDIIKSIYRYYNELNKYSDEEELYIGINCEAVTVSKDTTGGNYGNIDDAGSGNLYLDLDDYVLGVLLAGNASDAYTKLGSNREALLNYYKAMAVTVRSFTLSKTNNCVTPILDSSKTQIYDNPSYYERTEYYRYVEQAVNDTSGEVALDSYKVLSAQYDDFDVTGSYSCSGNYCTNIYTKVPNSTKHIVKVPSGWINSSSSNYKSTGKGLSKYGAMYLALQDYEYLDIVANFYGDTITFSTVSDLPVNYEVAGDYSTWRQFDSRWGSVSLGATSTIKQAGCTCTSIAIQIARSGTETLTSDFNPGTLVRAFNRYGLLGYYGDLLSWSAPEQTIAPNFKWVNSVDIKGTVSEKASALQNYLDRGYYMILGVRYKGGGKYGHWVALDRVSNNVIYIFDPSGLGTNLYDAYSKDSGADVPLRVIMWKKLD